MYSSSKEILSSSLVRRMLATISEYELVKKKESDYYKTVKEFCKGNKFSHQNFMRIYHRWQNSGGDISMLVPQKRGPKFRTRRTDISTEKLVIELRKRGLNRYETVLIFKEQHSITLSPSTVYNIFKRYGLNKLKVEQKIAKKEIIMSRMGELVHIDCHHISRGITIAEPHQQFSILGVIDGYSRLVWLELLDSKKSLEVMFATMRALHSLRHYYGLRAETIMTDNGSEFGGGKSAKNKLEHPFERMLIEMDVKHVYTKPYRPQTNGKIERFWKTLKDDFIEDTLFENADEMKEALLEYNIYYNEHRPHSALNGVTPKQFIDKNTAINDKVIVTEKEEKEVSNND